jgi:dipeptidyl aminopeptidase/acylaminoacyl peptidase
MNKNPLSVFIFEEKMMKKFFFALALLCLISSAVAAQRNYTIQQYLNIRSAGSPTLSPDGKRLAYLTNVSGTSQVWMLDLANPAGTAKQITNYEDNVGFVRWSPAGNGLVFGKSRGGDENTQFFLMSNDGLQIKELTANPNVRHNFGDWSKDGRRIYYASNKRDRNFFDVYSMDVATGTEELIFQQNGSNNFAAASRDGSRIIVSRSGTKLSLDNNLYLIDVSTKKETLLTPHQGSAQFDDVHFLTDNEIEFTTNDKREFKGLASMFLDGNVIRIVNNSQWDIDTLEFSPQNHSKALVINREGFSELEVYEAKIRGKHQVKLPAQGVVGGMSFSENGKLLAFTFNSAKYNTDIWLYDLNKKSLTQITRSDRAGIAQESFVDPQLIKFKSFDGREIPAWYYKPLVPKSIPYSYTAKNRTAAFVEAKVPVIVSVHGGPEGQERPGFNPLYQYYLSRGYAVLATNVRGSTGYGKTFTHLDDVEKREDSVKDLAYAVEWLKTSGGADPKRIAVMGGSYGGYMTMAAITLYPELWAAAVNTVGIVNWETFLKNTSGYRRRQREVEYGMLDKDIAFLRRISPIAKVDKIKTPLFVIHGKNDPRVPYTEAEQIVTVLRKRGGIVEYKLYDDEGHGVSKLKNRLELYPLVADFLDKYMK